MSDEKMRVATVDKSDGTVSIWSAVQNGVRKLITRRTFPHYGAGRHAAQEFEAAERAAQTRRGR